MKKISQGFVLFLALFISHPFAFAAWVWSPEAGKFINPDQAVQDTPQQQYDYAMEHYKKKDLKETIVQLRLLLKKYPGSQIAPEAQYRLGTIYEERGDYFKAFRSYRDLISHYPQSERMSESLQREFRIGNLFLSGKKAKVMGLSLLPSGPRAIEVFKHIVEAAPYSEFGDKAQFNLGMAYKKTNQFDEAIEAFQGVVDHYPKSELIPQARFQLADTSYLQSIVATRDQRVIDRASEELDHFLTRYPDSSVSDKAARLRQEIDEKNAEKNYRIGLFYEKENFLDSAFIYYRDVAERYPHTQWGKKSQERLQALEKPAEYLKSQEAEVFTKRDKLVSELKAVGDTDPARKKDLGWELKRVEKQVKELQKSKPEMIKRRLAALKQKEKSLKEKRKALAKKKKRFSKNPSEDLVLAFNRWEASLNKEEKDLAKEKLQIQQWQKSLDVKTQPFFTEWVPFTKEAPSPLQQVDQIGARRFHKLAREKRKLLIRKEGVYQEYEKLMAVQGLVQKSEPILEASRQKLDAQAEEIKQLEKTLEEKEEQYKKQFGIPAWQAVLGIPTHVLEKSVDVLNPFEGKSQKNWESKSVEELNPLRDRWQEKVNSQKAIVDVISRAFDEELKLDEKTAAGQGEEKSMDPSELRRRIKQSERQVRGYYNEIQDRNDRKDELVDEIAKMLQGEKPRGTVEQAGRVITAPARGAYLFGRAFLFGLDNRDVKVTEEAKRRLTGKEAEAALLKELHEQVELESVIIETRNQEILRLKREVEDLRAQASLLGAPPARPILVKVPYVFMKEAVVSANRLVPHKDRREKLIEQLNQETAKLEQLKKEWAILEGLIKEKSEKEISQPAPAASTPVPVPATPAKVGQEAPNQQALQDGIKMLQKQLEVQTQIFEENRQNFEKGRWLTISKAGTKTRSRKLKKVEKNLVRLIEEETKIQKQEKQLLSKKKEMVDRFLTEAPAELFSKELEKQRQEIDSRLHEIQNRQAALGEELKRLSPEALPRR